MLHLLGINVVLHDGYISIGGFLVVAADADTRVDLTTAGAKAMMMVIASG